MQSHLRPLNVVCPWGGIIVIWVQEGAGHDCFGGLRCLPSEAEVLAIAEHQHVPEISAGALAEYLLKHRPGANKIHCDSRAALRRVIGTCQRAIREFKPLPGVASGAHELNSPAPVERGNHRARRPPEWTDMRGSRCAIAEIWPQRAAYRRCQWVATSRPRAACQSPDLRSALLGEHKRPPRTRS